MATSSLSRPGDMRERIDKSFWTKIPSLILGGTKRQSPRNLVIVLSLCIVSLLGDVIIFVSSFGDLLFVKTRGDIRERIYKSFWTKIPSLILGGTKRQSPRNLVNVLSLYPTYDTLLSKLRPFKSFSLPEVVFLRRNQGLDLPAKQQVTTVSPFQCKQSTALPCCIIILFGGDKGHTNDWFARWCCMQ